MLRIAIDAVGIRGHGGAAVLRELLHWLPMVRPGWQWHVFLFDRRLREFDDPPVPEQVTLEETSLGNSGLGRLAWVNRHLAARLAQRGADLLFSFANIAPASAALPQVVFCHQYKAFFPETVGRWDLTKQLRMGFMRRQIIRGALASQAMIVQTDAMRQRIATLAPSLETRLHVIPSGYRTPASDPVIRPAVQGLVDQAEHPRLIYVSHPSEHKNHLALVRAMPAISRTHPTATLLLTLEKGSPPNRRYAAFIDNIQKEAARLGIADRLVWLGQLTADEVAHVLRSSDLTVFPSMAESFGLGLVESLAAGCPIAAADLPYAREVCGEAAHYFDPANPEDIANTVLAMLKNEAELVRLKRLGAERKDRYVYIGIAERIARLLESAVERV